MIETFEDPKVPQDTFEVPGGYIKEMSVRDVETDEISTEKVRFDWVTLREMRGHEEDILADDKKPFVERIHKIISRCIVGLEAKDDEGNTVHRIEEKAELARSINSMLMSDVVVLTLRLRQVSLGDQFSFKIRCPDDQCRSLNTKRFDLSRLEYVPMQGDPLQRLRTYTSREGDNIVWKMISGQDERSLQTIVEEAKKDKATTALLARVQTINSEPASPGMVKDLPMFDRAKLRGEFDAEGGVDTEVVMSCSKCGLSFESQIPITGESFFTLSETSDD